MFNTKLIGTPTGNTRQLKRLFIKDDKVLATHIVLQQEKYGRKDDYWIAVDTVDQVIHVSDKDEIDGWR